MKISAISAIAICTNIRVGVAYRIHGDYTPFVPFDKGFVQNIQDPTTAKRTRVNQGYAKSVQLEDSIGNNRLFSCPKMVGPFEDNQYYCRGEAYGYCDRRSGTCFCNEGYTGESCEECTPTHFEVGGLCYPKRVCPNDCSNAGQCNFLTGQCECSDHREGEDCTKSKCSRFHRFCTHCNDDGCIQCEDGFSVHSDAQHGSQCEPCWRFDPRCRDCNASTCTSCIDLLLLSIHRSGRRPQDPPLPVDELMRELSITVPFGSNQDDAFYDAEHYFLVDHSTVPLKESAVECHQGLNFDDSFTCIPYNLTSHIMCGNHGTITFDSPEYAVKEDGQQIRLTLQRTGGGVGEVSVTYSVYPMTAGYEDLTSTAYYTANHTIVFRPGQIRASFLITINDDRNMEANETFSVHLSNPTGQATIGTQGRTIVTIIDDDEHNTCSEKTTLGHANTDLGVVEAGDLLDFTVYAKSCDGNDQQIGGDVMRVEAHRTVAANIPQGFDVPITVGRCIDLDDGTYACGVNATTSGKYEVDVYQLVPGGLKGFYYTDSYLSEERLDLVRTDAGVNFTWGMGAVTTFGRDFVSVRWEGYVKPSFSETYTFWLDVDDHARLWIDGVLLIDSWTFSPTSRMLHAEYDLNALEPIELVLEYREILGNATARLLWSSASTPLAAIPSSSLFYKEHIKGSPFLLQVLPSKLNAKETKAFGKVQGTAGEVYSFTIKPTDRFGNFRGWPIQANILDDTRHLDQIHATVEFIADDDDDDTTLGTFVPVVISYNADTRMYYASYVPQKAGTYRLSLADGKSNDHIFGSPYIVQTHPDATFGPESIAFGGTGNCLPGIEPCPGTHYGMAGINSTFTVQAIDKYRNLRHTGGDDWKVQVSSDVDLDDYQIGTVEDHGDGTVTVSVAPQISGPNDLIITLNDQLIKGSPFRMDVVHGPVVGGYVVDEDNVATMTAMTQNVIHVQAADEWGNNAIYCNYQPDTTIVLVEGEDINNDLTVVSYVGGGKYQLLVTPLKSGQVKLGIQLNGFHIMQSPFNLTVHPGSFSASETSASGEGTRWAIAGEEASFILQSKDEGGNSKVKDEAMCEVQLVLTERSVTPVSLDVNDDEEVRVSGNSSEFIGDGRYLVKYTCFVSGKYMMHVRDSNGQGIAGSPFAVQCSPAEMSAMNSIVLGQGLVGGVAGEVAPISVFGRDWYGNFVDHAVEMMSMNLLIKSRHESEWELSELDSPVGTQAIKQSIQDSGGGRFVLDYTPQYSGKYELELSTYSPGGLAGSYYSSPDLLQDHLISTSLDKVVERYWEHDPMNKIIGTRSHFGAEWNGQLSADHDEEYQILVECNDGGHTSLTVDGKHIEWQPCYPVMSAGAILTANKPVDFSLRYRSLEGPGSAFVLLKWSSPTVPVQMIQSRNLLHHVTVGSSSTEISPNTAHNSKSVAIGDALQLATSGVEQSFVVELRDAYGNEDFGNLLLDGGSLVEVNSVSIKGQNEIQVNEIADLHNGTYRVRYTPGQTGVYTLSVSLHGNHIKDSPFLLTVKSGETDPANCYLIENMIKQVAGQELLVVTLQTIDVNMNHRHEGGDKIEAVLSGEEEDLQCQAEYTSNGQYSIICPPAPHSGNYLLNVNIVTNLGAKPIHTSPHQVTIVPGSATPERTEVTSGGQDDGNSVSLISPAGLHSTFVVSTKDRFSNRLLDGGNHFVARIHGDTNVDYSERRPEVIDQGNGSYLVAYKISTPSTFNIDVEMVTSSGLLGEYYMNVTSFSKGTPMLVTTDKDINFNTKSLDDDSSFSDLTWSGYISFPHAGTFDFGVTGIAGKCKLWIEDEMIIDSNDEYASGSFSANENILHAIKIEYVLNTNSLALKLFWSSRKIARHVVPGSNFFSLAEPIQGSPFELIVEPG